MSESAPPEGRLALRLDIVILVALLLLAAGLRFWNLAEAPPGLFRDEWEKGYTALQLWQTGRHGILGAEGVTSSAYFPFFIETFEGHDRTSAIYQYLSAPFVGIWGLSAITTRFVAALAGVLAVGGCWILLRFMLGSVAAHFGALALAIQPTAILFSRWAQQGSLVPLFTLLGFAGLYGLPFVDEKQKRPLAILAAFSFILAAYSYDPVRLVLPVALILWLATRDWSEWKREKVPLLWSAGIFGVLYAPLFVYTLTSGSARLGRVSIFSEGLGAGIITFLQNYAAHFSPEFWVIQGDLNSRHTLEGNAMNGWGMTVLVIGAVIYTALNLWHRRDHWREGTFLVGFLAITPLAASLTIDAPHALRAGLMPTAIALLVGYAACALSLRGLKAMLMIGGVLLTVDLGRSTMGVGKLADAYGEPWAAGVIEALRQAQDTATGTVYTTSEIPYAPYAVLFAEETDPAEFQEFGLDALKTKILPPGQEPQLSVGDVYIGKPQGNLPLEYFQETVVIYTMTEQGIKASLPVR